MPRALYVVFVCSLFPLFLNVVALGLPRSRRLLISLSIGGTLLALPWSLYALEGHADDALVMLGVVVAVAALRDKHSAWAILGFLIAIAAKPTAIVFLPLLFTRSRRDGVIALVCGAAIWTPFILANAVGFVHAGSGIALVQSGSLPAFLSSPIGESFPGWIRPAQLLGGVLLCWFVALRKGALAAVAAVVAFRAMLEPGAWPSYSAAVVAGAVLADAWTGRRTPSLALIAFGSWCVRTCTPSRPSRAVCGLPCWVS